MGDRENPLAVMLVSALRTKISPHMVPARPVLVDHFLNIANTPEAFAHRYVLFMAMCLCWFRLVCVCAVTTTTITITTLVVVSTPV